MLEHFNFNHNLDDLVDAMGFNQRDYRVAKMTVQYEIITEILDLDNKDILIDSRKLGNRSITLERTLKRLEGNIAQQILSIYVFNLAYQKTKESLKNIADMQDTIQNGGGMSQFMEQNAKIEGESLQEALAKLGKMLSIRPTMEVILLLKETRGAYDKYIAFTVDGVSFQDALEGDLTPKPKKDEDDPIPESLGDAFKEFLESRKGKKESEPEPKKDYGDIDDIIKRALGDTDEEEK